MALLDSFKNIFSFSKLREHRFLAPLFIWYEELPPDQKNIARLMMIGAILFLILFILYVGYKRVSLLKEEIASRQNILKELTQYEEIFHRKISLLKQLEQEARLQSTDFSLLSTLENLAQQAAIGRESIESITPKQLPPGKYFIETEATVQMVRVTLRQLVDYFHRIETSKNNLRLKEARIKPRFDNPQFLNITFKVSSFIPKE